MYEITEIDRLDRIADRMDNLVRLPIVGARVGLDSILGLIPGIGDIAALGPAGYIIYRARQMGTPKPVIVRMAVNTAIDAIIGSIPLVGDIFDIGNKANKKNVALLRRHMGTKKGVLLDAPVAA